MTASLWTKMKTGDEVARQELILGHMGLVGHVSRRFAGRGIEMEELIQIGSIGLIKAIDHFQEEKGFAFSTYAVPFIMGEIRQYLRDDTGVHISRSLKEQAWKIKEESARFEQEQGHEPTIMELSEKTGLSRQEIVLALTSVKRPVSVDEMMGQEEPSKEHSTFLLVDENARVEEKTVDHILLSQLVKQLDRRERHLLSLRYYMDLSQVETAKRMGLTQASVSRMEKKVLSKMRRIATMP